jgi:hypothetical protein
MLRIFRHLRQHFSTEGKFSRYLFYAIGEIVLVVIGILIALQVNNWNSERLARAESQKYIEKLSQEIQLMISAYDDRRPFIEQSRETALEALRFLESCGGDEHLETSFVTTMDTHQTLMKYVEIRNTYDEMISTGAFSAIEDVQMKGHIFRAYNVLSAGQTQIDYFRDEVGRASAVINTYVSFSYDASGEITVGYQIDDICRNAVFRNAVVEIIDARGDWLFGLGLIRSAMQEALETMIPTPELQ